MCGIKAPTNREQIKASSLPPIQPKKPFPVHFGVWSLFSYFFRQNPEGLDRYMHKFIMFTLIRARRGEPLIQRARAERSE